MTASNIDTTGYVDLKLFDKTAQEIYDDALAYVQWVIPDWEPAETNMENVIMQAIALMVAEGQYTMNRLPGAVVEVLMQLHGVTRITGQYPTVTVKFTTLDSAGYTIPAGTQVLYDIGDGGDPIVFTLNANVVIASGVNNGNGVMTGSLAQSRFNSIPAGTTFTVVTPLSYLLSVVSTTIVSGGTDAETDAAYYNRAMLRLSRLTEALVLPSHYESYALEYDTSIYRAKCIDRYNPPSGTPGSDTGFVAVAVYGNNAPVSSTIKTNLLAAIQAASIPSLTIKVIDPETVNMIGVHVSVRPLTSASSVDTVALIAANLRSYLSTGTWPWSTVVRWSNIVGLIENTTGVDYIISLTLAVNRIAWAESVFLTGISNWTNTTNCTLAFVSNILYPGLPGGSLRITPAAAGNVVATSSAAVATNSYTATATKQYWLSGYVFTPSGQTTRTVRLGVQWFTSANASISSSSTAGVVTIAGQWITIGEVFTAPANTAKALINIQVDATASTSELFYLDYITLAEYQTTNTDVTLTGNAPLVTPAEIVVTSA